MVMIVCGGGVQVFLHLIKLLNLYYPTQRNASEPLAASPTTYHTSISQQ